MTWRDHLQGDPLPWLLDDDDPAVRATTLQRLLDLPPDHPDVRNARSAAMDAEPVRSILAAQHPDGWWSKPGPGYSPKYRGTVWQVVILDRLGADGGHPQVAAACDYVLRWCPTSSGGFGCSGAVQEGAPPPSRVIHCLNGDLLRALIGFGRLDDERVGRAVDWVARAITGEGIDRLYESGTKWVSWRARRCQADGPAATGNTFGPCARRRRPASSVLSPADASGSAIRPVDCTPPGSQARRCASPLSRWMGTFGPGSAGVGCSTSGAWRRTRVS